MIPRLGAAVVVGCAALVLGLQAAPAAAAGHPGRIRAVGAENEYANVIAQVGGRYVAVSAVMRNPNTDPHTFEASPSVARLVGSAELVVQNGLGYDSFMNRIEAAAPRRGRRVIDVRRLLGLPATTPNPHLWYRPTTMPEVAAAVARDLSRLQPAHAGYFRHRLATFRAALGPWLHALARLRADFAGAPVATTEPVADYMLRAAGLDNRTPWTLQADVMNGVDLSPQGVASEEALLNHHRVRVFIYNRQVVDSLTATFLGIAERAHIPVVGVYETMPSGFDYQSWMLAEVEALQRALAHHRSTQRL